MTTARLTPIPNAWLLNKGIALMALSCGPQVAGSPWLGQVQSFIGSPSQAAESTLRLMARSAPPTMDRQPARPALDARALRPPQVQAIECWHMNRLRAYWVHACSSTPIDGWFW